MPTKRRRHAITETPPVEAALRRELGTDHVILGAATKLASIQAERDRGANLLRRLADQIRSRSVPVDVDEAERVRRSGWARS